MWTGVGALGLHPPGASAFVMTVLELVDRATAILNRHLLPDEVAAAQRLLNHPHALELLIDLCDRPPEPADLDTVAYEPARIDVGTRKGRRTVQGARRI